VCVREEVWKGFQRFFNLLYGKALIMNELSVLNNSIFKTPFKNGVCYLRVCVCAVCVCVCVYVCVCVMYLRCVCV